MSSYVVVVGFLLCEIKKKVVRFVMFTLCYICSVSWLFVWCSFVFVLFCMTIVPACVDIIIVG